jgi:cytochrome P450
MSVSVGVRGLDHRLDRTPDVVGGAVGVGLTGVEPGDDGLQCDCGDEPCRPLTPGTVRDPQMALGDLDRGGLEGVDHVAELGFSCGVAEQQPESIRIGRCGTQQHGNGAVALALPLPILVICELLGVPYEDRQQFRAWTNDVSNTCDRARSERGLDRLFVYGQQLVAAKRSQPGEDVISRLVATPGVSDDEAAHLSMALLFAGHETTVVQIGLTALLLLANREQWQALGNNPGLVANAVEETLRASRGGGGVLPRYARTDLEIDGVAVKAGELVLLDVGAGNHDPAVFVDPDRVDVTRTSIGHLAFGYGPRYCIGAPLARMELQVVFAHLASRFPDLRLAVGVEELRMRRDVLAGGLTELPVRW